MEYSGAVGERYLSGKVLAISHIERRGGEGGGRGGRKREKEREISQPLSRNDLRR